MKLSDQITRRQLFVAFGTSQQTGSLSSVDLAATSDASAVTLSASDGSVAPVTGADASKAGVMTAADKVRLDGLPPTTVRDFDSFSDVPGAGVAGAITHLRTAGHASGADGGGGLYRRVASEPAHAGKVQSADGSWWELVPRVQGVSVHQFGAKGDDATDDTSAVQAAIDYANSKGQTLWLHRGKTYRVTNLSMNKVQNFTMRATGSMPRRDAPAATALAYHGTAGGTLLYLHGVLMADIEGVVFKYGSAAPDAYIKHDYDTGFGTSTIRLHNVLIYGNGRTDGSVGVDMGPAELQNDSDHDWGRVELRSIQTGVRLNHDQCVGYNFNYIRAVGCGTWLDIREGGNLKINTLNCTNNDTDVKMRGGGSNSGTLTIDNAHVEQAARSAGEYAAAVFLDAAADLTSPITVVLNNAIVQNNYTGTFMKVGKATTVICNGGHLNGGDIDLSGASDGGDALFVMLGGIFGGTFTANDFGYYEHKWPSVAAGGQDPWGRSSVARSGRAIGFDRVKMKGSAKNYTTIPLSTPGSTAVRRTFPTTALITGIEMVIETNAVSGLNDFGRFDVGGVSIAEIAIRDNGARKIGWSAHDLQANDVNNVPLGDPSVTAAFSGNPIVDWKWHSGEVSEVKSATGYCIIEWIDTTVGLTGSDP